jgi:DNA polymerase I
MYVLHKAHGNFALPSKGQQSGEEFEGGAVFDPITGVREMVAVLDLASLYPMAMVTMNASPETKVGDDYDGESYVAPNGQRFRKEPDGIMREMVDELLTEREQKKDRRDEHEPGSEDYKRFDRQQASVKVIMNSLYGVSGWERFRLYDRESAAAVTATGREVIKFTEEASNELNRNVIYGDSIIGDRPVVVRDPGGMVRIVPIEQLFQRGESTKSNDLVITADGGPVASIDTGKDRRSLERWEALSVNEAGESEWKPIQQVIRHETEKPVVKLQHKFGESITTEDHSYVVEEGGELVEASPKDVSEPFRVRELPKVDPISRIDVYHILSGYTREYKDGRSVGKEDAVGKVKHVHANDDWVWFGHAHHEGLDKTVKVKRHIDLDSADGESLVRLLAAYITEGSASTEETANSRFGASIAESNREWLETVQNDYYRLFTNTTASVITSDSRDQRTVNYHTDSGDASVSYDDRTLKLQMMSELAAVFFREFAGQTSRGKRIPSFVFHLSDELQTLFIDTLVEGDG